MELRPRGKTKPFDPLLFVVLLSLLLVGVFIVASSSWSEGIKEGESGSYYLIKHLRFMVLGGGVCFLGFLLPSKFIKRLSGIFWLFSLFLCLLLFTNLAKSVNGSARWLAVPGVNFQFMPADVLKYSSILFLGNLLEMFRKNGKKEGFIPILLVITISVGVVIVRDFSSASVIGFSLMVMFFVSGIKFSEFILMAGGGMAGFYLMLMKYAYRVERLMSFTNPFDDIADTDWQLANSLYALGMGSITGVGYFNSRQKFSYLPESYNDFIFAIFGEEFGFIGVCLVIALFIIFVSRGLRAAQKSSNFYEKNLAVGITSSIGIQAFFNMGVASGILPVTGITLPFISYGGTALILAMGVSGILLKISRS